MFFVAAFACAILGAAAAQTPAASTQSIEGRIVWPDTVTTASKIKLVLSLDDGRKIFGWPRADGNFVLHEVPEGVHLLDVVALGLIYPQVRLEVNGAYPGKALVTLAESRSKVIPPPLLLRPTKLAEYFENREPFNIIGLLKTPYGLMAAFGIFAVFILPKLRIDSEEENKTS